MRWSIFAVLSFIASLTVLSSCGGSPAKGQEQYGEDAVRQSLDVTIPSGTASGARLPAVVFIHGGHWNRNSLKSMEDDVNAAVARGFVGVTINYRYSTVNDWPAQIQDAKCAVRFIKANADRFNIDPLRVAVAGYSAGAHLAMMVAFSQGVESLESCAHGSTTPNSALDSSVKAVVSRSGINDLFVAMKESGHVSNAARNSIRELIGAVDDLDMALRVASPKCYVDNLPMCNNASPQLPVLQIHGDSDSTIMPLQPEILHQRLMALGFTQPRFVRFCNQPHDWNANKASAIDLAVDFLRQEFYGELPDHSYEDVGC